MKYKQENASEGFSLIKNSVQKHQEIVSEMTDRQTAGRVITKLGETMWSITKQSTVKTEKQKTVRRHSIDAEYNLIQDFAEYLLLKEQHLYEYHLCQ